VATLLTQPEVMRLIGVNDRMAIWRLRQAGSFPEPVRVGTRNIFWKFEEIQKWSLAVLGKRIELA
jgi:predicted DNA-binding transcriptional regulator AlpA